MDMGETSAHFLCYEASPQSVVVGGMLIFLSITTLSVTIRWSALCTGKQPKGEQDSVFRCHKWIIHQEPGFPLVYFWCGGLAGMCFRNWFGNLLITEKLKSAASIEKCWFWSSTLGTWRTRLPFEVFTLKLGRHHSPHVRDWTILKQ